MLHDWPNRKLSTERRSKGVAFYFDDHNYMEKDWISPQGRI